MEANQSFSDDTISNLGSSVGGIHSDQRPPCKFPQANKATVSYKKVNRNGHPAHLIYEATDRGQKFYVILECPCARGSHPFGYNGCDFVKAAKRHLRTAKHNEVVIEYRERLKSQGIEVTSDFFVIEELGRRVRGCTPALANENNRQFCEVVYKHEKQINLEKYCSYGIGPGRTRDTAFAAAERAASDDELTERSNPVEITMHGAIPAPNSDVTSRSVTSSSSGHPVRRQLAIASIANNTVPQDTNQAKNNRAVGTCAVFRPRMTPPRRQSLGGRPVRPASRRPRHRSRRNSGDRALRDINNMVMQWQMTLDHSLE